MLKMFVNVQMDAHNGTVYPLDYKEGFKIDANYHNACWILIVYTLLCFIY
jgi:hypothetical protein